MLNVAVWVLAIVALVLELFDVLSTYRMLARGGHEANPIVAWFMHVLGDAWPLCKIPEMIVILIVGKLVPKRTALMILGFIIACYSFVVWYNYQI